MSLRLDDTIDGGAGQARLFGAFGDDVIQARDGAADVVDGGPGRDRATADGTDVRRSVP